MSVKIIHSKTFERNIKQLAKRYKSLQNVIFSVLEQKVFLLYMYDKSDRDSISDKELIMLLKKNNLI